jgi:hypothetical protein
MELSCNDMVIIPDIIAGQIDVLPDQRRGIDELKRLVTMTW